MTSFDEVMHAFCDSFRGSFGDIRDRLATYEPMARTCAERTGKPALDLGAGRGEWLSLCIGWKIEAYGVDANPRYQGNEIQVLAEDACAHLAALAAESLGLVTAFHIIEHIDAEEQWGLISQAARVLAPGGMLIVETPNWDHTRVHSLFWVDPTHRRPVARDWIVFAMRQAGLGTAVETLNGDLDLAVLGMKPPPEQQPEQRSTDSPA